MDWIGCIFIVGFIVLLLLVYCSVCLLLFGVLLVVSVVLVGMVVLVLVYL